MEKLRAVLIDDEWKSRKNLRNLLAEHCREVEVVAEAESATDGKRQVEEFEPDVVFLDIHMPVHSGFDFLDFFEKRIFDIVFVTAYDQYAIRAIKASAVDYILKPIDLIDLKAAIAKILEHRRERRFTQDSDDNHEQMSVFSENLQAAGKFKRIIISMPRGIKIVKVADMAYLKGESNYSQIVLESGDKVIVNKTLRDYEEILGTEMFYRIHKSFIVNMLHVEEYFYSKGGYIALKNGEKLPVSRRRVKDLLDRIEQFVQTLNQQGDDL